MSKKDWSNTFDFLDHLQNINVELILNKYGVLGVEALSAASPKNSGLMSSQWSYEVVRLGDSSFRLEWHNMDIERGLNVAILVQYGHGTRGGTYVQGRDFINPAMRPIMDSLADDIWKEVTNR